MNLGSILRAFLRRDWGVARSYRLTFVTDIFGTLLQLTLFFALGQFFDRLDAPSEVIPDQGYFAFLLLGMMVLGLGGTGLTAFSQRIQSEQTAGSLEALLATPASPSLLILASSTYHGIRAVITVVLQLGLAFVVFGLRFDAGMLSWLLAVWTMAGVVVFFAALGIVLAGFAIVFKRPAPFMAAAMNVLVLLGGVYYPVDVLPWPMNLVAQALPLTWGIEILRAALLMNEYQLGRLLLLTATAAIALPIALWIFRLALNQARRDGSLGQY